MREPFVPGVPEMPPCAYPGAYLGNDSPSCAYTPSSSEEMSDEVEPIELQASPN